MDAAQVPGLALGVVQGDRVVHLRGFGAADDSGRAVTPQTPLNLGSVTKSFTALAVMQVVEKGQIRLDAPVQRYPRTGLVIVVRARRRDLERTC